MAARHGTEATRPSALSAPKGPPSAVPMSAHTWLGLGLGLGLGLWLGLGLGLG